MKCYDATSTKPSPRWTARRANSDDGQFGGWGYWGDPPRRPSPGELLSPSAEPNLSATVFALTALRAAGLQSDAPEVRKALRFVRRCQNFADDARRHDAAFDDGGFFFIASDPVRNKAGIAGVDRFGCQRFASYGSATSDGLRALLLCGASADEPRVIAAWRWLESHFSAESHPGRYVPARASARQALYFYYCHSLAECLILTSEDSIAQRAQRREWAAQIAGRLIRRQRADGSWINSAVDVREDDPLVATSLAARALTLCRRVIMLESAAQGSAEDHDDRAQHPSPPIDQSR